MDISSLFLPSSILKNFTITSSIELCDIKTRVVFIEVYLVENNIFPDGYNSMGYES